MLWCFLTVMVLCRMRPPSHFLAAGGLTAASAMHAVQGLSLREALHSCTAPFRQPMPRPPPKPPRRSRQEPPLTTATVLRKRISVKPAPELLPGTGEERARAVPPEQQFPGSSVTADVCLSFSVSAGDAFPRLLVSADYSFRNELADLIPARWDGTTWHLLLTPDDDVGELTARIEVRDEGCSQHRHAQHGTASAIRSRSLGLSAGDAPPPRTLAWSTGPDPPVLIHPPVLMHLHQAAAGRLSLSVSGADAARRAAAAWARSSQPAAASSSSVPASARPGEAAESPCFVAVVTTAKVSPFWLDLTVAAKVVGGRGEELSLWAVVPLQPGTRIQACRSFDGQPFQFDGVSDVGKAFGAWAAAAAGGRPLVLVGAGVDFDVERLAAAADRATPEEQPAGGGDSEEGDANAEGAAPPFSFSELDTADISDLVFAPASAASAAAAARESERLHPAEAAARRDRALGPSLAETYALLFPEEAEAARKVAAVGPDEADCVRALARVCEHPSVRMLLAGLRRRSTGGVGGGQQAPRRRQLSSVFPPPPPADSDMSCHI